MQADAALDVGIFRWCERWDVLLADEFVNVVAVLFYVVCVAGVAAEREVLAAIWSCCAVRTGAFVG